MHYWSKNIVLNAIVQPELFVEIGEALAKEKGIANGSRVTGAFEARRDQGRGRGHQAHADAGGQRPEGAHGRYSDPLGFIGVAKKGHLANTLTPFVGDANVQTPEFKAFLVNIEKA